MPPFPVLKWDQYTVLDYGADPTGTVDSTAAIQDAIDAAESVNRGGAGDTYGVAARVLFNAGNYLVSDTLRVKQHGVSLVGQGIGNTRIVNTSPTADTFYFGLPTAFDGFGRLLGGRIEDVTLWNSARNPSSGAHIHLDRAGIFRGRNLLIVNHYEGIRFAGTAESCMFDGVDILQGSNTTALQPGSCGVRITRREVDASDPLANLDANDGKYYTEPNSVYLSNFNIRSSGFGAQFCVDVDSVDGLYASNSHWGFADTALVRYRQLQDNIGIVNVQMSNIFFDGQNTDYGILYDDNQNLAASTVLSHRYSNTILGGIFDLSGVTVRGETDDRPERIKFTGGEVKRSLGTAFDIQSGSYIRISDFDFFANGSGAQPDVHIRGGDHISITDSDFHGGFRGVQITDQVSPTSFVKVADNMFGNYTGGPIFVNHADTANDQIGENLF